VSLDFKKQIPIRDTKISISRTQFTGCHKKTKNKMAKELLKEAIADAKAVREVALQNAKMALEEAFDSKIKNMLSAKLAEEIEEDDLDEAYMEDEKEKKSEAMSYDEDDKVDEMSYDEDDQVDEEINLDELMAELEETSYEEDDDGNKGMREDDGGKMADFDKLEKALGENSETNEGLDESVIGALAGIPLLIAATGGIGVLQDKAKDKEFAAKYPKIAKLMDFMEKTGAAMASGKNEGVKSDDEAVDENFNIDALVAEIEADLDEDTVDEGATGYDEKVGGKGRTGFDNKPGGKGGTGYDSKTVKKLKEERNAAIATVKSLQGTLSEMNLLNSKLLYCNKLFRANALTEAQKVKVVDALDMANTANEAKLVFSTLQESFNFTGVEKRAIKEGLGRASKASGNAPKKVITESVDETVSRFQKLANIKF